MENLQEQIAKRAFELFVARGGQHGYHIQDWLQAEQDVMKAAAAQPRVATPKKAEPDAVAKVNKEDLSVKAKTEKAETAAPVKSPVTVKSAAPAHAPVKSPAAVKSAAPASAPVKKPAVKKPAAMR